MSFEFRPVDITTLKCDAIVNSLGIGPEIKTFGKLCTNILKAADAKELKDFIYSKEKEAMPGKLFITPGYNLKAKNIIHVVTPCYYQDENLLALEDAYRRVLMLALKNEYKHIAVPIIGTGANKYPHGYVLKMLITIVKAFTEIYPNIKVTIATPVANQKEYDTNFNQENLDKSVKEYFKENAGLEEREFSYDQYFFERELNYIEYQISDDYLMCIQRTRNCVNAHKTFLKETDALLESGKRPVKFDPDSLCVKSVTDYITKYIETRFSNETNRTLVTRKVYDVVGGIDNKTSLKHKHSKEEKRATITPSMLMRYVIALHMTQEEADDLFLFCGRAFSPISNEDKVYKTIIRNKIFDVYSVITYCVNKGINPIFTT